MISRQAAPAEEDALRAFWERADRPLQMARGPVPMLGSPVFEAELDAVRKRPGHRLAFSSFARVERFPDIEASYALNGAGLRLWRRKDYWNDAPPVALQVLRLHPLPDARTGLIASNVGTYAALDEAAAIASALYAADPALQLGRQAALMCGLSSRGTARHGRARSKGSAHPLDEDSAAA